MPICDCELSHNGIGLSVRECDCPAGQEAIDRVWDEAKAVAKGQLGDAAIDGMPSSFPSMNPYDEGCWQHEEYEAAHEHYIMTGLGY